MPDDELHVSQHPSWLADTHSLDLFQRILLTTDGNVTQLLEAYAGEPMEVVKLSQAQEHSSSEIAELAVALHERVVKRRVLLQGSASKRGFLYAESTIAPDRLPAGVRRGLVFTRQPIGSLLSEHRVETFRELLGAAEEPAGALATYLAVEPTDTLIARTYRIACGGRPVMLITERFPRKTPAR